MTVKTSKSRQRRQAKRIGDGFWDFLTVLTLLALVAVVVSTLWIYQFPDSSVNPYPPPTVPASIVLPTATPTLLKLPSTFTPEPTQTALPTRTPVPATVTSTPTIVGAGTPLVLLNTPDADANYPFAIQTDPSAIEASVLYPERGCEWLGIGGQVTDLQGRPVTGISVQLGGSLSGVPLDQTSLTGLATRYGEAGYEFELAKAPLESNNTLWVRLIDQARLPLSARVYFQTFAECSRNLTIVNFRQVR